MTMGQETFGEVLLHGLVFRINSAIIEFALALAFEFFFKITSQDLVYGSL